MHKQSQQRFTSLPQRLIALIGVIVPRRFRTRFRQEWEAELQHREARLRRWRRLDWRNRLELLRRSSGAFWDALLLQPRRLEDEVFQDLRFGLRMLLRQPGFTAVALLTLSLGIGANTAIFSVVNGVLLRPLPFQQPERLAMLWTDDLKRNLREGATAYANVLDWRSQSQSFAEMAIFSGNPLVLTESVALAMGAGLLGLALAAAGVRGLLLVAPPGIPRLDEVSLDPSVLLFTLGISLCAGLFFGLAPAWKISQQRPQPALKENSTSSGGLGLRRTHSLLAVLECALAVVLLTGAGLLIRSFLKLQSVNPGFNPAGVLLARVSPPLSLRGNRGEAYFQQVRERIAALPGVQAVASTDDLLIRGTPDEAITIEGRPPASEGATSQLNSAAASPEFFHTLGVPLLRGRFFTRADALAKSQLLSAPRTQGPPPVAAPIGRPPAEAAIINETFARRFFPNEDPIGKRFYFGPPTKIYWYEIVGVVGDMHRQGLERQPIPEYFGPHLGGTADVVVRVNGAPPAFAATVREAIRSVDKHTLILNVTTAEARLGELSAERRLNTWLLALFAALALVLAVIGIYGVMHYSVAQRRHEIGVRLALGAQSADVLRLVIGQGLRLMLGGVALGLLAAFALTRVLAHLLFGVSAHDPLTFSGVALLLAGVAIVACYLPARRAAQVDPLVALRCE